MLNRGLTADASFCEIERRVERENGIFHTDDQWWRRDSPDLPASVSMENVWWSDGWTNSWMEQ